MSGGIEFEGGPLATHARKVVFLACWGFGVVGFVEVIRENDDETGEAIFVPFVREIWEDVVWEVHVVE